MQQVSQVEAKLDDVLNVVKQIQRMVVSGYSSKTKTHDKKDFRQKSKIVDVFFAVIEAYNKNYSQSKCEKDMKTRILKQVMQKADKR